METNIEIQTRLYELRLAKAVYNLDYFELDPQQKERVDQLAITSCKSPEDKARINDMINEIRKLRGGESDDT